MFEKIKNLIKGKSEVTVEDKTEEARHLIKSVMAQNQEMQEELSMKLMDVMKFVKEKELHPVVGLYLIKGVEFVMADALHGLIIHCKEDEASKEELEALFLSMMEEITNISEEAFRMIALDEVDQATKDKAEELMCRHECGSCKKKAQDDTTRYIQ